MTLLTEQEPQEGQDMSEEKDDANKIAKVRWSKLSEMQIDKLRQENKSLESRLKESEKKIETLERVREQMQKEIDKDGAGRGFWHVAHSCVPKQQYWDLEQRLSQAEAERDEFRKKGENLCTAHGLLLLEKANLMDVAGKMAGFIKWTLDNVLWTETAKENARVRLEEWEKTK